MGAAARRFDGRDFYISGAASKRNISGLDIGAASGSNLLQLGVTKRGIPFNASSDYPDANDRVNYCTNTNELKTKVGIGNDAYDCARFTLAPSNDPGVNGAPKVGSVRVNKATKASSVVKDIDTDDVLDLTSVGYGLYTNQIQYKISAGSVSGKKLSTKFEGEEVVTDNIDKQLISIQYTGAGTGCVLTVDPAGNLTTTCAGAASDDLSISLATYNNIQSLVDFLDSQANYTALLIGDGTFPTNKLDKIISGDAVNIKPAAYNISAILKAVEDTFTNNDLLNAALSSGAERRVPANMTAFVFLTTGSDGSPVLQDWIDALSMCELIDASFVTVATGEAAVHSALAAHVKKMSGVDGKNERQGGCGNAANLSNSNRRLQAKELNANLVDYFATDGEQFDEFSERKLYPGFVWGCAVKGMQAGNAITLAPTKKSLVMLKVGEVLGKSEQEQFIQAGCQIAQPDNELGGIRVVRSVTTYQGSNIIANESSAMRTSLFIAKDHRKAIETYIGEAGDNIRFNAIATRAENKLDDYVDAGYLVIDPDKGNAYRNFEFKVEGDVVKCEYEGTLVIPINFIFVTHNFTVLGVSG